MCQVFIECIPTCGSAWQRGARTHTVSRAHDVAGRWLALRRCLSIPAHHLQGCGRSFVRLGACLTADHVREADAIPRDRGHVGSVK
eukprot:359454-Pleurochrysis_carterae.AAC.4